MSEPLKPGYTWQVVTVTQAEAVSAPIDLSSSAIIAIATQAAVHVALFWVQVQIGEDWYTLAMPDGNPLDFRLMSDRALAIPTTYTRPYDLARIATPPILHDYVFQVCVEVVP